MCVIPSSFLCLTHALFSFKLSKANVVCPDSTESLHMTMTEVLKRQCSKSKKGYKQVKVILNLILFSLSL